MAMDGARDLDEPIEAKLEVAPIAPAPALPERPSRLGPNERGPRKAINLPYSIAGLFAGGWLFAWGAYLGGYALEGGVLSNLPALWSAAIGVTAVLPAAFAFLVAYVINRGQELKNAADATIAISKRMTEPDEFAAEKAQSVGRAVAREIELMSGSLDSALARLAAVETAMDDQIGAVERASGRAEARAASIRAVLKEEREALNSLSDSLGDGADAIIDSVDAQIERLKSSTADAAYEIAQTKGALDGQLQTLEGSVDALSSKSSAAAQQIAQQAGKLEEASEVALKQSEAVSARYDNQRAQLADTREKLREETTQFDQALEAQREFVNRLSQSVTEQAMELESAFTLAQNRFDEAFTGLMGKAGDAGAKFREEAALATTAGEDAAAAIIEAAENAAQKVSAHSETSVAIGRTASNAILEAADAAADRFKGRTEGIIADGAQAVQAFANTAGQFEDKIKSEIETAAALSEHAIQTMREQFGGAKTVAQEAHTNIVRETQALSDDIQATTTALSQQTAAAMKEHFDGAKTAAEEARSTILRETQIMAEDIQAKTAALSDEAATVMKARFEDAKATASDASAAIARDTKSMADDVLAATSAFNEEATKALEAQLQSAKSSAAEARTVISDDASAMSESVSAAAETAQAAANQFAERVTASKDVVGDLASKFNDASNAIEQAGDRLKESVTKTAETAESVKQQLGHMAQDIDERIANIPDTAADEAARIRGLFDDESRRLIQLSATISEETEKLEQAIQERKQGLLAHHLTSMDNEPARGQRQTKAASARAETPPQGGDQFLGVFSRGGWESNQGDDQGGGQPETPIDDGEALDDSEIEFRASLEPPSVPPEPATSVPETGGGVQEGGNFWKTIFARIDESDPADLGETPTDQDSQSIEAKSSVIAPEAPPTTYPVEGSGTEFQRASLHIIEALQAMAIDIDRLLEEDPPIELWQRYQNGERNVFARRLLSLKGDDLHDKIRRKYREDPEFGDNTDRYIERFEALLNEAVERDRENILADTYLTSQTGKVYLMLAQAIGKFD